MYAERHARPWLLIAGALGDVATLIKQTGVVLLVGIAAWVVVQCVLQRLPNTWGTATQACAALAAGAGAVLACAVIALAKAGALPDVVNQTIVFNLYYVSRPANVNGFLVQVASQSWAVCDGSQSGLWVAGALGLCLCRLKKRANRDGSLLALAWLLSSAATVVAAGAQLHINYYLALVPPLSVLGGYAFARLWDTRRSIVRAAQSMVAIVLLLHSSQFQNHQYGNAWYSRIQSNTHSTEEFVAGAVGTDPGSLFVWGSAPQVYALTGRPPAVGTDRFSVWQCAAGVCADGRPPASRYLHTIGLSYDYAFHTQLQQNRAELMATLENSPPRVIAIIRDAEGHLACTERWEATLEGRGDHF